MIIETLKLSDPDTRDDLTIEVKVEEGQITLTMEDSDFDTGCKRSMNLSKEDAIELGEWLLRNSK